MEREKLKKLRKLVKDKRIKLALKGVPDASGAPGCGTTRCWMGGCRALCSASGEY